MAIPAVIGWKDQDWAELLACMRWRKVIPVIGEELLQVQIEGSTVPLYSWMAERLASALDVPPSELPSPASLNDVACKYLLRGDSNRNLIYMRLSMIMEEAMANLRAPAPLRQLAEITDFNLFLTTTFDPLMESALNQTHKREPYSLAYSPSDKQEDLPITRDLSRPTVYHIFGKLDVSPNYAVSREDLLEWLYKMESQSRPKNLFDELRQNYLLILGAAFPDWLPWFLRLRSDNRLSETRKWFEFLADSRIANHPDLVFLRHFSKQTKRYEGGAVNFVDELWTRWTKSRPARAEEVPAPLPPESPRGAIFISYAREDLEAAKKLKAGLDATGLEVWFDKEKLQGGDTFALKITSNIKRCSYFLPLISRNSVGQRDRFFIREWNCALDRAQAFLKDQVFIVPVVIDQTDIDAAAVPEEFKSRHVVRLAGGEATPDFKNQMQKLRASWHS